MLCRCRHRLLLPPPPPLPHKPQPRCLRLHQDAAPAGPTKDQVLLTEIRDLLKEQNSQATAAPVVKQEPPVNPL